jgi:hypothetical protein
LIQSQRALHILAYFRRDRGVVGKLRHWVARCQRQDSEDHQANYQQGWDGEQGTAQDILAHWRPLDYVANSPTPWRFQMPLRLRQQGTCHYICVSFLRSTSAKTKHKKKEKYRYE